MKPSVAPRILAIVVVAALFAGCSGPTASAEEVAAMAQRSLDERDSGRIQFALRASSDEGEPVGFEIEGRYAFEEQNDLAVLDLTYSVLLDEDSEETRILSTGDEAWVVLDGESTRLTDEQSRPLRVEVGGGSSGAIPAVDLGAWLMEGEVVSEGERTTVTGEVNASAFVRDLQSLASDVTGAPSGGLDEPTAEQIERAATDSEMTLMTEADELRSVRVTVDFGARVPPALRKALGTYAAVTLELSIQVEDIPTPLRIEAPT